MKWIANGKYSIGVGVAVGARISSGISHWRTIPIEWTLIRSRNQRKIYDVYTIGTWNDQYCFPCFDLVNFQKLG